MWISARGNSLRALSELYAQNQAFLLVDGLFTQFRRFELPHLSLQRPIEAGWEVARRRVKQIERIGQRHVRAQQNPMNQIRARFQDIRRGGQGGKAEVKLAVREETGGRERQRLASEQGAGGDAIVEP